MRELCSTIPEKPPAISAEVNPLPWFAVVVKPQHERVVRDGLSGKGLDSFLPTYRSTRHWSDRQKRLELPLFPGYVFCRFAPGNHQPVLRTPGVRSIVAFGTEYIPVPDSDIEQIRRVVSFGSSVEPWSFLSVGQRVRVHTGPLSGLDGILVEVRDTLRVVVGLELLHRAVAVPLDRDQLMPLGPD